MKHRLDLPVPKARKEKLIIKELPDETLVYDLVTDKAHCLNLSVAEVWKRCDGQQTVSELRDSIQGQTGIDMPDEMVWLALDELKKFRLLEDAGDGDNQHFLPPGITRRQLVRQIGFGAAVFPLILTITSPTAAQSGSAGGLNHCCGSPGDCNPGLTCRQSPSCLTPPPADPSTKACLP